MPNQFFSPEGDLENYFVDEYWLIDQYIGDQLWSWGEGARGYLGNASINSYNPTPVTTSSGGTNWKQVDGGQRQSAGIKLDGTLWVWGNGDAGRLGNNSNILNNSTPITTFAGGTNWKQIEMKGLFAAAIKTDGTLWTWGYNGRGQLGIGNNTISFVSTPVTTLAGGTNWKQVSVGYYHASAIKTDGTLWTWGDYFNDFGMLGKGDDYSVNKTKPVPITTTGWADTATTNSEDLYTISAGYSFSSAIKTDGTLWTWGNGNSGQLGNAQTINRSTPVTTFAGGTNWRQVSSGGNFDSSCAGIKTDGTLWVWGNGRFGILGNAIITGIISTPVTTFAGGANWKQVSVSSSHTVAIKTDGTLWTWGAGTSGRLGNAVTTNTSTPVTTFAGGINWKHSAAIFSATLAIKTDGTLWTWGSTSYGQLGNATGPGGIRSTPVTTFAGGTNWKQVGEGGNTGTSTAIKTDGTLWTWGFGLSGALGNGVGYVGAVSTPITTFAGGTNWKQVANGRNTTVAVKTDGTLWTWGRGTDGELGNAVDGIASTPVTTFTGGTDWKQVSGGFRHVIALKGTSPNLQIFSFGSARDGQMGDGFNIQTNYAPGQVFGNANDWKEVSSGYHNNAAIKTDGTLWTWGYNYAGNIGVGDSINRNTPITTFAGGTNWKQVSVGGYFDNYLCMAAIKTDGTLWTWGSQNAGMLANFVNSFTYVSTPITTFAGGTNWKYVDIGNEHVSAIKTDGTLWMWGENFSGQLGNGDALTRSTPVTTFAGGTNWKQVRAAGYHTLAVQSGINADYPLS
jgi:alpha-tubulin suppressor-like RCC1 family protein